MCIILQEAVGGLEERARDRVRVFGAPSCPIGSGTGQNKNGTTAITSKLQSFKGCPEEREIYQYIYISYIPCFSLSLSPGFARAAMCTCVHRVCKA